MLENLSVCDALSSGLERELDKTDFRVSPLLSFFSNAKPTKNLFPEFSLRVLLCRHQKAGRRCLEAGRGEADSFVSEQN